MTNRYLAAAHGDIETVRTALDKGADVNALDEPEGTTLLHIAAEEDHIDIVKLLIERGADTEVENGFGETPLHQTAVHECPQVAEFLIQSGADYKRTFEFGNRSLLHVAALHDSVMTAIVLINHRLDVNALDDECETPLHVAAQWNHRVIADLFIQHSAKVDLWIAGGLCDREMAQRLLDQGAGINDIEKFEKTPLHSMVDWEREDSVKFMLSLGADPNVKDSRSGMTSIFSAAFRGKKKIAQLLISSGADVNARSNDGRTALHFVGWSYEVVALLISNGADINAKDNAGNTPLHEAAILDNVKAAKLFLSASADSALKNNKSETALMLANEHHSRRMLRLFKKLGIEQ
ncbi:MAG: ankyrin repeat domain-containing protein [Armatimonadota bacterium]